MTKILIISFWNPIPQLPSKGLFIHEHVKAVCKLRSDIVFLEINILPSKIALFQYVKDEVDFFSNKKITLNIYSLFWKFIYSWPWISYILIKKILKSNYSDETPELIHSNIIFPCAIVGHLLSKKWGCKHIISEHWSKADMIVKHSLYKKSALSTFKSSNAILCVSDFLANKIRAVTHNDNIVRIPNIIDTNLFKYTPKMGDSPDLCFTCVAYWEKPKRLDLIIHSVIAFAKKTNRGIKLNVIGMGSQRNEFFNISCSENLSIIWKGYLSKFEIAEILQQSSVLLHASDTETFSIVSVEAFSTGTPVLASNTGALPELIHPSNGILVENTIDAWINGLIEITRIKYNNEAIAKEVIGKYDAIFIGRSIEEVYLKVLAR